MIITKAKKLFSPDDDTKVIIIELKENSDEDTPGEEKQLKIYSDGSTEWGEYSPDEVEAMEGEIYESEIYSRVENVKVQTDAGVGILEGNQAIELYALVEKKVQNSEY